MFRNQDSNENSLNCLECGSNICHQLDESAFSVARMCSVCINRNTTGSNSSRRGQPSEIIERNEGGEAVRRKKLANARSQMGGPSEHMADENGQGLAVITDIIESSTSSDFFEGDSDEFHYVDIRTNSSSSNSSGHSGQNVDSVLPGDGMISSQYQYMIQRIESIGENGIFSYDSGIGSISPQNYDGSISSNSPSYQDENTPNGISALHSEIHQNPEQFYSQQHRVFSFGAAQIGPERISENVSRFISQGNSARSIINRARDHEYDADAERGRDSSGTTSPGETSSQSSNSHSEANRAQTISSYDQQDMRIEFPISILRSLCVFFFQRRRQLESEANGVAYQDNYLSQNLAQNAGEDGNSNTVPSVGSTSQDCFF
ncbi:hypothetical protein AYI69_g9203 [Smittium culicis]|uniref:Uncharacterized protein n=1 Tax=Smittium culicis TaxID=133412 RepID=A0A1R1XE91_9FUNG|nr:hypothetical protein AYI69_g9203 [Smittium culicis]